MYYVVYNIFITNFSFRKKKNQEQGTERGNSLDEKVVVFKYRSIVNN